MNTPILPSIKPDAAPTAQRPDEHQNKPDESSSKDPNSDQPKIDTPSIRSVAGLFLVASLFALAGGSLDAYSYLTHDHVFSTAVSGDVIQFGVYGSGRDWTHAMRFLPPIGAFVVGTAVARLLGVQTKKHTFRATLLCRGLEGVVLFLLTLFGANLSSQWVVPLIAFCAALQNTSFGALGPWKFNDAMTTGNLRNATSSVVFLMMGRDIEKNRGQAVVSFTIFVCFLAGALFGGLYTRHDQRHALAPTVVLVLVGFVLTWRQRLLYQN